MPRGNVHIKDLCNDFMENAATNLYKTKKDVIKDLASMVDVLKGDPSKIHELNSIIGLINIEYSPKDGYFSKGSYEDNLTVCFALLPMVDLKTNSGVAFIKWDNRYDPKTIDVSKIL